MSKIHEIGPENPLGLGQIEQILRDDTKLKLSAAGAEAVEKGYRYLRGKIEGGDDAIYGINTGFGFLCDLSIGADELAQLQLNLLRSHACGMGERVPKDVVRLMLLLKAQNLSYGFSGVRVALVERILELYNRDILPVVYEQGSLGASGDLAPLAHLALPLVGEGEVIMDGKTEEASQIESRTGLKPLVPEAKEGLALINGTQFCSAYALLALIRMRNCLQWSHLTAALSYEAYNCRSSPLYEGLHRVRKQQGQRRSAAQLSKWLEGSDIDSRVKYSVQDPYSFRCCPQVFGASMDAFRHTEEVVLREIDSVTDNPIVFPDEDRIVSGGNFHAQPLALCMDYLAIASSELASIAERRLYHLVSGQRELPPSLTASAGLNSGLMIIQYTAASIVSQNKQLCSPASVDSIVSSFGQEDHVSMGANAATKLLRVIENTEKVIAIEFMAAAQAMEFRDYRIAPALAEILSDYRKRVPRLEEDRALHGDMMETLGFLREVIADSPSPGFGERRR